MSSSDKLDLNITSITAGTRTPTQVSPLSKGNDIFVTESTRIKSTPRPRGRPRLTNLSTCKSIREKHESRFISQTPVTFDLESPSNEQVRLSSHRSSLLTSDRRHELKGKMATRQSARRINFIESIHTNDKKEKKHKFVGIYQDYINHVDPTFECSSCGALLWYAESMRGATNICSDSYSMCCGRGKNLPYPDQEYTMDGYNRLIYDETSYDKDQLQEQHVKLYGSLTMKQKGIYSTVMDAVDNNKGGMFFVYGYGGTGKTYLYKTMLAVLHSKGDIVLNVASSGIAALLLEGGRTSHSRFAIPINDEAPMINMHCYEAFDRILRDICRTDPSVASDKVFGGKVVLFGGDFRQILLVITNGGRQDVVNATINSSYLWGKCIVLRLTVNMRLGSGSTESEKKKYKNLLIGY
nr:ATP-dependent DNA helicase PIF1-like [Tanacetum cinerariifolium]